MSQLPASSSLSPELVFFHLPAIYPFLLAGHKNPFIIMMTINKEHPVQPASNCSLVSAEMAMEMEMGAVRFWDDDFY